MNYTFWGRATIFLSNFGLRFFCYFGGCGSYVGFFSNGSPPKGGDPFKTITTGLVLRKPENLLLLALRGSLFCLLFFWLQLFCCSLRLQMFCCFLRLQLFCCFSRFRLRPQLAHGAYAPWAAGAHVGLELVASGSACPALQERLYSLGFRV